MPPITDEVTATELSAVRHCQQKWSGALVKNLKRHKVAVMRGRIVDPTTTWIGILFDGKNCALCERHVNLDESVCCSDCILYQIRGGFECWHRTATGELSPFEMFAIRDDPKPMLRLLKRAERHLVQIEKGKEQASTK